MLDIDVHGWTTFAEFVKDCKNPAFISELKKLWYPWEIDDDDWIVWFDTAHWKDTLENCTEKYVIEETERFRNNLEQ